MRKRVYDSPLPARVATANTIIGGVSLLGALSLYVALANYTPPELDRVFGNHAQRAGTVLGTIYTMAGLMQMLAGAGMARLGVRSRQKRLRLTVAATAASVITAMPALLPALGAVVAASAAFDWHLLDLTQSAIMLVGAAICLLPVVVAVANVAAVRLAMRGGAVEAEV